MISPKESIALRVKWEAQKTKLKVKFPQLNDADLNFEAQRKGEMLSKLQVKTGRTARELQSVMESE